MSQIMSDNKVSAWCPQSTLHQAGGRGHCCCSPHNCPVARIQSYHEHIESENLIHCCLTLNNVELWPPNLSLVNTPHPAACSRPVLYYVLIGIGIMCALLPLASIRFKILWENFKLGGGWVKYSNWTQYSNKQISSRGGLEWGGRWWWDSDCKEKSDIFMENWHCSIFYVFKLPG